MRLRVLDFDGSLVAQPPIQSRLAAGQAELVDLRRLGPRHRLWSYDRDFGRLVESLAPRDDVATLNLIGSGDLHHVTSALIARIAGPLSVIQFDNHPDCCWSIPRRHCGSWVNKALAMPHVRRVVTLGPCSDDLARPERRGVNLRAMAEGRLEIFPWNRSPSPVRRHLANGPGHDVIDRHIHWRNLKGQDWARFLEQLAARLPPGRLWITIDKDVLSRELAVTNWDQGEMPLEHVLSAVQFLASRFTLAGADICGDFAPVDYWNPIKRIESWIDQPVIATPVDTSVNALTNARLIEAFERVS